MLDLPHGVQGLGGVCRRPQKQRIVVNCGLLHGLTGAASRQWFESAVTTDSTEAINSRKPVFKARSMIDDFRNDRI